MECLNGEWLLTSLLFALAGSGEFTVRESAQKSIQNLPAHSILATLSFTQSNDPEVALRAQRCLEFRVNAWNDSVDRKFRDATAEYCGYLPWIDSLPLEWPDRKRVIGVWLSRGLPEYYRGLYGCYSAATAAYIRNEIESGMSVEVAQYILRKMQDRQQRWSIQEHRWTDE